MKDKRLRLKGRRSTEAHVRMYRHELECAAWQTLSPDARALLIEMRALYRPAEGNVIFLSVREAMRRLGVGQRRAEAALDQLQERGWITLDTPGGFSRKTRHATSYRLENEPPTTSPGSIPRKLYMSWNPSHDEGGDLCR